MAKKHWTAERNGNYLSSPRMKIQLGGVVLRYNPTPEPPLDEKGRPTAFSLTFPAIVITSWVSDSEKIAAQLAQQLNTYPVLVDALKRVESLMTELGAKGEPLKTVRAAIAAADAEPEPLS